MSQPVRPAEPRDLPLLPAIERSADGLFRGVDIVFPAGPTVVEEVAAQALQVLVVGDPPVGFAAVVELDGHPHLEQIAVHADHTGQGLGVALLKQALRDTAGLTLITFRDVPWNRPWYSRHGFDEWPESAWGPELRAHWQAEVAAGLHQLGPRLVMRASRLPS